MNYLKRQQISFRNMSSLIFAEIMSIVLHDVMGWNIHFWIFTFFHPLSASPENGARLSWCSVMYRLGTNRLRSKENWQMLQLREKRPGSNWSLTSNLQNPTF